MVNFWDTDRTDLFKSLWEAPELTLRHVDENFQEHWSDMEAQASKIPPVGLTREL